MTRRVAFVWLALTAGACSKPEAAPAEAPPDQRGDAHESSTLDRVMTRVEEGASELAERAVVESGELSDWSQDQLNRFLRELETYGPVLEEAGYTMGLVRVRMGMLPAVTVVCRKLRTLSDSGQAQLLARYKRERFKALFLRLLFRADRVKLAGHEPSAVWVTISLNPHATVVLEPPV